MPAPTGTAEVIPGRFLDYGGGELLNAMHPEFGAAGDGTTIEAGAIQKALNKAGNERYGGVLLPTRDGSSAGLYNLGTTTLTIPTGVRLVGIGRDPDLANYTTPFTKLIYTGTGAAVKATSVRYVGVENLLIDIGGGGAGRKGIHFNGAWLSHIKGVDVKGAGGGYAIDVDVGAASFGSQHLRFQDINFGQGIFRLKGNSGSDAVTTSFMETIRGISYEFDHVFNVVAVNCTAEAFTSIGYDLKNADGLTLLECDIEGAGTTAIAFGAVSGFWGKVHLGGFTGTNIFTGTPGDGSQLIQRGGSGAGAQAIHHIFGPIGSQKRGTTGSLSTGGTAAETIFTPSGGEIWMVSAAASDDNTAWRLLGYVWVWGSTPAVNNIVSSNMQLSVSGSAVQIESLSSTANSFAWRAQRLK